jgi:hypothetical protein
MIRHAQKKDKQKGRRALVVIPAGSLIKDWSEYLQSRITSRPVFEKSSFTIFKYCRVKYISQRNRPCIVYRFANLGLEANPLLLSTKRQQLSPSLFSRYLRFIGYQNISVHYSVPYLTSLPAIVQNFSVTLPIFLCLKAKLIDYFYRRAPQRDDY